MSTLLSLTSTLAAVSCIESIGLFLGVGNAILKVHALKIGSLEFVHDTGSHDTLHGANVHNR